MDAISNNADSFDLACLYWANENYVGASAQVLSFHLNPSRILQNVYRKRYKVGILFYT